MERSKTVSCLMDKGAIGIEGDGDCGVVLSVGHMEPGTEDHAPKKRGRWPMCIGFHSRTHPIKCPDQNQQAIRPTSCTASP